MTSFNDIATEPITLDNGPTVIYIEDEPMPTPAYHGYQTTKQELVKAERNIGSSLSITTLTATVDGLSKGFLIKRHIAWKYTIDVEWKGLTAEQKTKIMNATGTINEASTSVLSNYDEGIKVRFLDLDTDTFIEKRMYRGADQSIDGYGRFIDGKFQYYDIKMSLIEL